MNINKLKTMEIFHDLFLIDIQRYTFAQFCFVFIITRYIDIECHLVHRYAMILGGGFEA